MAAASRPGTSTVGDAGGGEETLADGMRHRVRTYLAIDVPRVREVPSPHHHTVHVISPDFSPLRNCVARCRLRGTVGSRQSSARFLCDATTHPSRCSEWFAAAEAQERAEYGVGLLERTEYVREPSCMSAAWARLNCTRITMPFGRGWSHDVARCPNHGRARLWPPLRRRELPREDVYTACSPAPRNEKMEGGKASMTELTHREREGAAACCPSVAAYAVKDQREPTLPLDLTSTEPSRDASVVSSNSWFPRSDCSCKITARHM
jgi:hypothetical protein